MMRVRTILVLGLTALVALSVVGVALAAQEAPAPSSTNISQAIKACVQGLWQMGSKPELLGPAAVAAIALLSAFLTVVQVWQIPPPDSAAAKARGQAGAAEGAAPTAAEASTGGAQGRSYGGAALLVSGNFGRTVLSGLAGLALVSTFDELWLIKGESLRIYEKPFFLVLFVVFFLTILVASALFRGFTESLRSRVALVRRDPPAEQATDLQEGPARRPDQVPLRRRFWWWWLSLKIPLLVFWDTFFNVIQGRNQLRSAVFEQEIAELHLALVAGVDQARKALDNAVLKALDASGHRHPEGLVRTSVAILSNDGQEAFYVARERGSLATPFPVRSLAWLAIYTGLPMWWSSELAKQGAKGVKPLVQDTAHVYPLLEGKAELSQYFSPRAEPDYEAFVVLPLPWGFRGANDGYRKAGVVISFPHAHDLERLWPKMKELPHYDSAECAKNPLISPQKDEDEFSRTVDTTLQVITELLRFFNDTVFEEYVRPRIRPT